MTFLSLLAACADITSIDDAEHTVTIRTAIGMRWTDSRLKTNLRRREKGGVGARSGVEYERRQIGSSLGDEGWVLLGKGLH